MNAPVYSPTPNQSASPDLQPSDKEIALLAFEHWKHEGSPHLRPEHWLTAEKELKAAYAKSNTPAPSESDRLEDFWVQEMETASCYAMDSENSLATKGWS